MCARWGCVLVALFTSGLGLEPEALGITNVCSMAVALDIALQSLSWRPALPHDRHLTLQLLATCPSPLQFSHFRQS